MKTDECMTVSECNSTDQLKKERLQEQRRSNVCSELLKWTLITSFLNSRVPSVPTEETLPPKSRHSPSQIHIIKQHSFSLLGLWLRLTTTPFPYLPMFSLSLRHGWPWLTGLLLQEPHHIYCVVVWQESVKSTIRWLRLDWKWSRFQTCSRRQSLKTRKMKVICILTGFNPPEKASLTHTHTYMCIQIQAKCITGRYSTELGWKARRSFIIQWCTENGLLTLVRSR